MTKREPVEIVTMPERHAVGTVQNYTMDTREKIGAQWHAFFQTGYDIPNVLNDVMLGVSFGQDGQGGFSYAVAREVSPVPDAVPEGTCVVTLAAGEYAVLRAEGPMQELPATFDWLFTEWLPNSDYEIREGAVFERYPPHADQFNPVMEYEIWAAVQPRA